MEDPGKQSSNYTVFAGSSDRDVTLCKIFWNSVSLQPPLESRLVSGDMVQRLRPAGSLHLLQKNFAHQQPLEDLQTEYFILEAQREESLEQKAIYLQKAKRREEIISLLKKQREERIKKEVFSLANKPTITEREPRSDPCCRDMEALEEIMAVQQLK
ncbi:cilia- and flagella-associated protein HOATZ [Rhinophrynus dorsalis]